jgi:hypothetical protein
LLTLINVRIGFGEEKKQQKKKISKKGSDNFGVRNGGHGQMFS